MRVGIVLMGPASTADIQPATAGLDVPILTINCSTIVPAGADCAKKPPDGPTIHTYDFPPWITTLGSDPLGTLCKRLNVDAVYLVAFSAGAGGLEGLLQRHAGDPRIAGVFAADAYFGKAVKPGYMAHAKAVQATGSPFWISTGWTGDRKTGNSGATSFPPFADALGMTPTDPPSFMPPPMFAKSKGSVLWLRYDQPWTHQDHITKLAPKALRGMLTGEVKPAPVVVPPEPPPAPPETPSIPGPVVLLAGIAAGLAMAHAFAPWPRKRHA